MASERRKRGKRPAPAAPIPEGTKRAQGRPTIRTPELIESMLEFVSCGGNLLDWCDMDGHPSWQTIYRWLKLDEDTPERALVRGFARARELWCQALALKALRIAMSTEIGTTTEVVEGGEDGKKTKTVRADNTASRRLQVDTIIKLIARVDPTHWGDKLALGGDRDAPPVRLSVEEAAARVRSIVEAAKAEGAAERGKKR